MNHFPILFDLLEQLMAGLEENQSKSNANYRLKQFKITWYINQNVKGRFTRFLVSRIFIWNRGKLMTFQQTTIVERSIIQYNDNNNMIIENDVPL